MIFQLVTRSAKECWCFRLFQRATANTGSGEVLVREIDNIAKKKETDWRLPMIKRYQTQPSSKLERFSAEILGSRKMFQSKYFLTNIGFDTAENTPFKA